MLESRSISTRVQASSAVTMTGLTMAWMKLHIHLNVIWHVCNATAVTVSSIQEVPNLSRARATFLKAILGRNKQHASSVK